MTSVRAEPVEARRRSPFDKLRVSGARRSITSAKLNKFGLTIPEFFSHFLVNGFSRAETNHKYQAVFSLNLVDNPEPVGPKGVEALQLIPQRFSLPGIFYDFSERLTDIVFGLWWKTSKGFLNLRGNPKPPLHARPQSIFSRAIPLPPRCRYFKEARI